ncbi:histamine N-methyltransferase-like isoform X3 [Scyliorhinus canicula]|uniref:histamine N-methyltransferase-like isoform X3 n=1 Tax=Scyliorhinus canicula TaxID=7830 RepID=UPI0018F74B83|nr:histamine N-methyltransferase-like isoform X3 [Scyliorhinus canicula]
MESSMKPLTSDIGLYFKSFKLFLERSTEHQCMEKFIDENLPDVVTSIGKKGVSCLNVLGVGSGSGKVDMKILGKIQSKHPGLPIHNEVVEPNPHQITKYKDLVKEKTQGLNISFTWNQMRSEEYEKQNKERKESRKFDFIHMIQMLYFVQSVPDTIKYFHSLLETNGKLLIIQAASDNGMHPLWKKVGSRFPTKSGFLGVLKVLDEMRVKYQLYEVSSDMDITECFIEGNDNGERLLDFLTDVADFRKTAPSDLKAEVLHNIRHPPCSREENGKILFNNNLHFIVVDN